jgi:hypothetical protein
VDLLEDADPRLDDAHRALEGEGVLNGFGVDGAEPRELSCLMEIRKVGHARQIRAVLLAVVRLVEHPPAAICNGIQRLWIDAHLGRVDLQAVVELDGAVKKREGRSVGINTINKPNTTHTWANCACTLLRRC